MDPKAARPSAWSARPQRENGAWLATVEDFATKCGAGRAPLLHLWSAESNLVRRVLASPRRRPAAWRWRSRGSAARGQTGWNLLLGATRSAHPARIARTILRALPRSAGAAISGRDADVAHGRRGSRTFALGQLRARHAAHGFARLGRARRRAGRKRGDLRRTADLRFAVARPRAPARAAQDDRRPAPVLSRGRGPRHRASLAGAFAIDCGRALRIQRGELARAARGSARCRQSRHLARAAPRDRSDPGAGAPGDRAHSPPGAGRRSKPR